MNNSLPTEAIAAQQRQKQLTIIGAVVLIVAIVAYFSGGKKEETESESPPSSGVKIAENNGPTTPPNADEFYFEGQNDADAVEMPEVPAQRSVAENNTATSPNQADITFTSNPASTSSEPSRPTQSALTATAPGIASSKSQPVQSPAPTDKPRIPPTPPTPATAVVTKSDPPKQSTPPVSAPSLDLNKPAKPVTGVIAHTRSVITESEFRCQGPRPKSEPNATAAKSADQPETSPIAKPRAAKVTKPQAEFFAQESTRTWQAEGRIPATQRFRLPKQSEVASKQIWRAEDHSASPSERKTFGLVLADDDAASTSVKKTTAEGIPVKNIPEGESALKKNGTDKPLWKRAE